MRAGGMKREMAVSRVSGVGQTKDIRMLRANTAEIGGLVHEN